MKLVEHNIAQKNKQQITHIKQNEKKKTNKTQIKTKGVYAMHTFVCMYKELLLLY